MPAIAGLIGVVGSSATSRCSSPAIPRSPGTCTAVPPTPRSLKASGSSTTWSSACCSPRSVSRSWASWSRAKHGLLAARWKTAGLVGGVLLLVAADHAAIIDAGPTMLLGLLGFVVWVAFVARGIRRAVAHAGRGVAVDRPASRGPTRERKFIMTTDRLTTARIDTDIDVAQAFFGELERAWNNADGSGYGRQFAEVVDFVDIRVVHHHGTGAELGQGHQVYLRHRVPRQHDPVSRSTAPAGSTHGRCWCTYCHTRRTGGTAAGARGRRRVEHGRSHSPRRSRRPMALHRVPQHARHWLNACTARSQQLAPG